MHTLLKTTACLLALSLTSLALHAEEPTPSAAQAAAKPSAETQPEERTPARRNHDRNGGPATAQGDPQKSREMRALFEQVMIARLSQELELDDAQTILLVRRIGEVKEKAAQIRKERSRALREIQERTASDRNSSEIAPALQKLMQADQELARLRLEAYEKAAEGLHDWQRARLYIFLQEFDSEMRRLIERARSRAHGDAGEHTDLAPLPDHAEPGPGRNRTDRPPRHRTEPPTPPATPPTE
jgi:hypothetical protein